MEEYHTLRRTQGDKYCDFSLLQTFDKLNVCIRHLKTKLVVLNTTKVYSTLHLHIGPRIGQCSSLFKI
jgi:hypothetical protein